MVTLKKGGKRRRRRTWQARPWWGWEEAKNLHIRRGGRREGERAGNGNQGKVGLRYTLPFAKMQSRIATRYSKCTISLWNRAITLSRVCKGNNTCWQTTITGGSGNYTEKSLQGQLHTLAYVYHCGIGLSRLSLTQETFFTGKSAKKGGKRKFCLFLYFSFPSHSPPLPSLSFPSIFFLLPLFFLGYLGEDPHSAV